MTDATKLKPCPFCGDMTLVKGKTTETKYLSCEGCGAEMHGCGPKAASHVVRKWNRRSDIAPKVKPLVWVKNPDEGESGYLATCITGTYHATNYGWTIHRAMDWNDAESLDEAKSTAQARRDALILSALETQGEG